MATIILDIVEGGLRITSAGYELRRIARVHGLTGTASQRQLNAVAVTGMPPYGDPHPDRTNCLLDEINGEIESQDIVKFTLIYKDFVISQSSYPNYSNPPSNNTIQTGASLTQVETNKNYLGFAQKVLRSGKQSQGCLFTKFIPEPSLTITRIEYIDPADKAEKYVGKINMPGWNLKPFAGSGTWLCGGIIGISTDAGVSWQVTYSFMKRKSPDPINNADGWDQLAFWIDPETNRIPEDASEGDGQKTIHVYEYENFSKLNLP